jgi:Zn-dependent protease
MNPITEKILTVVFFICVIAILFFSIMIHEIAHGLMAFRRGDPTARNMGRLTLNPIRHLDKYGSILFIITFTLANLGLFPIPIGYAKPVMVDYRYFTNPRKDMAKVAVAGPVSNLILAFAFYLLHLLLTSIFPDIIADVRFLMVFGIFINLILAAFNLLPIPPLDGSNILLGFLPWRFTLLFHRFHKYGIGLILLVVILFQKTKMLSLANNFFAFFNLDIQ